MFEIFSLVFEPNSKTPAFRRRIILQLLKEQYFALGKDDATKTAEFSEKFQGGGAFPIQKFMLQILDL